MPLNHGNSHPGSDEHMKRTRENQRVFCEDCLEYVTDRTRQFRSETHILRRQQKLIKMIISKSKSIIK